MQRQRWLVGVVAGGRFTKYTRFARGARGRRCTGDEIVLNQPYLHGVSGEISFERRCRAAASRLAGSGEACFDLFLFRHSNTMLDVSGKLMVAICPVKL